MGGRKSYPTRDFLGGSREVTKGIKTIKAYIENKEIKEIPTQTFSLLVQSKKPISYSSYSAKFFPEIIRNYSKWKKITNLDSLKIEISKSWSHVKKSNKIRIPKEVDRIIVENAVKTVGGKK
jgi:hypothetical protein